jgi:hypothetical protein
MKDAKLTRLVHVHMHESIKLVVILLLFSVLQGQQKVQA